MFESIEITLYAAYSPKSGEWARIRAELDYSEQAFESKRHYQLPKMATLLAKTIGNKLQNNPSVYDSGGLTCVRVPGQTKDIGTRIIIGYKTREAAAKGDEDEDPEAIARTSIIIICDKELKPPTLIKTLSSMQQFQYVLPHTVDSFYEVLGLTPPNITFSLSPEYEVK